MEGGNEITLKVTRRRPKINGYKFQENIILVQWKKEITFRAVYNGDGLFRKQEGVPVKTGWAQEPQMNHLINIFHEAFRIWFHNGDRQMMSPLFRGVIGSFEFSQEFIFLLTFIPVHRIYLYLCLISFTGPQALWDQDLSIITMTFST